MLDLLATDEFGDWFGALPDRDAEDVATALEVLGKLGVDDTTSLSSDLLLWYQCLPEELQAAHRPGRFNVSDDYHRLMARIGQVLTHLESPAVKARLAQLPVDRTSAVGAAIGRIKIHTSWRRRIILSRDESEAKSVRLGLERDYRAALDALGVQEPPEPVHSLRQLELRERKPGIRILYGVNLPKRSALIVLGEYLDRRAYGPSVRRALSVWQRFAAGNEGEGLGPAPGTRRPT